MRIALDTSGINGNNSLQHRVRGVGTYTQNLKNALEQYYPENRYTFFSRGENLPKNIDLVHYPFFEPFIIDLPIRKRVPTVVTVHDLIPLVFPSHFPSGLKGKIKWEIQKILLRKVDGIITDSKSSKEDILKLAEIREKKVNVVYLAAGSEFKIIKNTTMLRSIVVKYNLPEKFVLYVGDVTWNKNLPGLIKAMDSLEIPLVMVGKALINDNFEKTNPWNQDLLKVGELTLNNPKIRKLGFMPTSDLAVIYNLAAVLAMPSLYEGFGLPVLEAMSCGCPVLVSNRSSLPEVAGEAGILVNPEDTEEIKDKLVKLLKLPKGEREELIEKGLKQAGKFPWKKTAEETNKVYEEVLKNV